MPIGIKNSFQRYERWAMIVPAHLPSSLSYATPNSSLSLWHLILSKCKIEQPAFKRFLGAFWCFLGRFRRFGSETPKKRVQEVLKSEKTECSLLSIKRNLCHVCTCVRMRYPAESLLLSFWNVLYNVFPPWMEVGVKAIKTREELPRSLWNNSLFFVLWKASSFFCFIIETGCLLSISVHFVLFSSLLQQCGFWSKQRKSNLKKKQIE